MVTPWKCDVLNKTSIFAIFVLTISNFQGATIADNFSTETLYTYGSLRPLLHQGSTESRTTLEQKLIFQIGTLNPLGINERFSFN